MNDPESPDPTTTEKPPAHIAANRLIRQIFAFVAAALLVGVAFWSMGQKPYVLPVEAKSVIQQALDQHYEKMQAAEAGLGDADPMNPAGPVGPAGGQAKPAGGRTAVEVISANERKSSGKVIVRFRVTYNGGPPPDGIAERSMTLTYDPQGKFVAGPVPAGVPALGP